MYVVFGATGNTGKPLTEALLKAGKKVRIVARDVQKAQSLVAAGAEFMPGDIYDAGFVGKVIQGAEGVFFMIPPFYSAPDFSAHQHKATDAFVAALKQNPVPYVVALSSVGAHQPSGMGVVQGLHYMEQQLATVTGINLLVLRAAYFMENLYGWAGMIPGGTVYYTVVADVAMPMVATVDIAAKAAAHLLAKDFSGNSLEYVLGPRDLTFAEVAQIVGEATGFALNYVHVPVEAAIPAMQQVGMSDSMIHSMNEFVSALNAGRVLDVVTRNAANTTPTDLKDFAPALRYALPV
ncbi:MAG: NmrA family NAD(P)-binding protein [Sphingobacteriia bacterium]